eukprot:6406197-Ditylum_brightwellii.AAC.3
MDCCAPIFTSICGLKECKLPEEPCIVAEIEGLCIIGGCVIVGNKQKGYKMFMQSENGAGIKQYNYYRDKVILPFITGSREVYDGYLINSGTPISDELACISCYDGNLAQIASIIEDMQILEELKAICNK